MSPDGEQVAVVAEDKHRLREGLWKLDVDRKRLVELPTGDGWKGPVDWTSSGDELLLSMLTPTGQAEIHRRGTRPGDGWELLLEEAPTRDGTLVGTRSAAGTVIMVMRDKAGSWDLWLLPPGEGATPRPIVEGENDALLPAVSPDERWLALSSSESGTREIYVTSFPGPSGEREMRLVSESGGNDPVWAADGRELFFEDDEGHLMSAPVEVGEGSPLPAFGRPEIVLDLRALELIHDKPQSYDVLPDGGGFVFTRRQEAAGCRVPDLRRPRLDGRAGAHAVPGRVGLSPRTGSRGADSPSIMLPSGTARRPPLFDFPRVGTAVRSTCHTSPGRLATARRCGRFAATGALRSGPYGSRTIRRIVVELSTNPARPRI